MAGKWFRHFTNEIGEIKEDGIEKINHWFERWGGFVYRRPYLVITMSLVFGLAGAAGFLPGIPVWVDGAENLYSLPTSKARDDGKVHKSLFNEIIGRQTGFILTSINEGANIFTWNDLDTIVAIDRQIRGLTVDPYSGHRVGVPRYAIDSQKYPDDETLVVYSDLCLTQANGDCSRQSILDLGVFDVRDNLLEEGQPPELYVFDGLIVNLQGRGFVPGYLIGEPTTYIAERRLPVSLLSVFLEPEEITATDNPIFGIANVTVLSEAKAFQMVYELRGSDDAEKVNLLWEKVALNIFRQNTQIGNLVVSINAFRSRDDELKASTSESSDILFIVLTFVILISYSTSLSFSCDLYKSKAFPALAGCGAALLGMVSGLGYMSLVGVAFVPTALVTPFLVMGIGVDDMFVIVNSYCLAYIVPSAEERCKMAIKDCGVSITITTLTNLIAFAVGAFSPYLSIRNFCYFSAASLAMGYFFCLTFFFAFLCIDAKREEALCVCIFCLPAVTEKEKRRIQANFGGVISKPLLDVSTFKIVALKAEANYEAGIKEEAAFVLHESVARSWRSMMNKFCFGKENRKPPPSPGETEEIPYDVSCEFPVSPGCSLCGAPADRDASFDIMDPNTRAKRHRELVGMYQEPVGTVGRRWRQFFLYSYGPFLTKPIVKIGVLVCFAIFLGVSIYGFTKLEGGLDLKELSPDDSYLQAFDKYTEMYFSTYDAATDVFFPEKEDWWIQGVQESLFNLEAVLSSRETNKMIYSPLSLMLKDDELRPRLTSGDKEVFLETMRTELAKEGSRYRQFQQHFIWEGKELKAWKFALLPGALRSSKERAAWMEQLRNDCQAMLTAEYPISVMAYNYMMIFYESDLGIMKTVMTNMAVAAVAMLLVALALIPQLTAGVLVILIMTLIDVGLFGFMYFWSVKLNMVSMINLVISIGFAVDYSAHMCHTFTHCEGRTRNLRMVESLVLMGNPVFHGAVSTLLGVIMLGFSKSFIFRVFFKMMTMVILFGVLHGVVLLPVLLSLLGRFPPEKIEGGIVGEFSRPKAAKPPMQPRRSLGTKHEQESQDSENSTHNRSNRSRRRYRSAIPPRRRTSVPQRTDRSAPPARRPTRNSDEGMSSRFRGDGSPSIGSPNILRMRQSRRLPAGRTIFPPSVCEVESSDQSVVRGFR